MKFKRILIIIIFSVFVHTASAQPPAPESQPQDPQGDPDVVPITGVEYLILAGGAYGVHRFRRRKILRQKEIEST